MDDHHQHQLHHPIQFQLPHFVYSSAPTLVPGGGAEVVPLSNSEWFVNNGFTLSPDNHFFAQQQPLVHSEHVESNSNPFDFTETELSFPPPAAPIQPDLSFLSSLSVPSPFGLPVYSVSGFDIVSILSRVHNRPNATVHLGPVDLTCSFVVVDPRRYDHPVVYCSPTFCTLSGYTEQEVLGRNCRFLQAPGGLVAKGEPRKFTSSDSVNLLRKSIAAGKDCQTSMVNYKKNGAAFINLITVIPIQGDDKEALYHVGFQVDLTEQPNAILEKLQNGTYAANFEPPRSADVASQQNNAPTGNARDRKVNAIRPVVMSKDLKRLLADPTFLRSFPAPDPSASSAEDAAANHLLHLFLLEASPDFIHVVSLKGSFLYVAPSVRRVLGYEAEEMIGSSIADYAHPEDVIPLMRELKESSATGVTAPPPGANISEQPPMAQPGMPRSVDLLFRAKTKMGRYVWVECRGRLHVEPGKGRKAIILTGRAREMMSLKWEDVSRAGGLAKTVSRGLGKERKEVSQEVWGMMGGTSRETATFLSVGQGMVDVLGWTAEDLLGRSLMDVVIDEDTKNVIGGFVQSMRAYQRQRRLAPHRRGGVDAARWKKVRCLLRKKDGGYVEAWVVLYRADLDDDDEEEVPVNDARGAGASIAPAALVYQIRLVEAETIMCGPDAMPPSAASLAGLVVTTSTSNRTATMSSDLVASIPSSEQSKPPPPLQPSLDMFEELSIARGTSWQYELQQLRFTNARLEEELVTLEAAAEAAKTQKTSSVTSSTAATATAGAAGSSGAQTKVSEYAAYEEPSYADAYQQQQQQQQLFSRGQLVVQQDPHAHARASSGAGRGGLFEALGREREREAYLHQPKPQYSSGGIGGGMAAQQQQGQHQQQHLPQQQQQQHTPLQHQGYQRAVHQRPLAQAPSQSQSQSQPQTQTWGTMVTPQPQLQPQPPRPPTILYPRQPIHQQQQQQQHMDMNMESMYGAAGAGVGSEALVSPVSSNSSSGLKRSWSAIDAA